MDFGFLTESVAFPVWGFGFVVLAVIAAVAGVVHSCQKQSN